MDQIFRTSLRIGLEEEGGGGKRHKDMETFSHQVVAAGTTEAALDPDKKLTHFDCGNKNA